MQQDMEYVYQVWLDRNFSRAAEKLYISQPALSMAIKKVEDQLGMPIFDRSTRPLSLTPAGEAYLEHIRQTRFLEQDLERQMEDIREVRTGHITLGGSHYLNAYILPAILAGFMAKYPAITINLKESSSAILSEMLANRELDLTFNCNPKFMADFERYPAFTDHVLVAIPKAWDINLQLEGLALSSADVAANRHMKTGCPAISLEALRDLDFILLGQGNNLHDRACQLFREAGIEPRVRMELSQLVSAYHLADAGIGATFVSDRLVVPTFDRLNYYKLDSALTTRQFYALLPKRNYTTIAVRTFIEYCCEPF